MITTQSLIEALRAYAPLAATGESHLHAAVIQATGQPGKLVRAQLVADAAVHHGLTESQALQLACAIEYYHTASLLLDDLPCMDDAALRRGLPCVHRTHGDATTILASLALINRAYTLIGLALVEQPPEVRLQTQFCLDAALGSHGLVGGQAADLRFAESNRHPRHIGRIALGKTGALFSLAVQLPALCAQPDATERHALHALRVYWGLAFQIADDLHDVLANPMQAGKTTGRDRALARPNLALALGVPATRRRLEKLVRLAAHTTARLVSRNAERWGYLQRFHADQFAAPLERAQQSVA